MNSAFNLLARTAFEFLEKEEGFRIVEERPNRVRFESNRVAFAAAWDEGKSFEAFFGMGLLGNSGPLFDAGEILKSCEVPHQEWPSGYQITDTDALGRLVQRVADLLRRYCVGLLNGRASDWENLETSRRTQCKQYAHDRGLTLARNDAQAAWNQRNYSEVVRTLEPWAAHLGDVDRHRLEYARKHR